MSQTFNTSTSENSSDISEKRFIDIESKLLHQDLTLDDLNKVIINQQSKIGQLEATLAVLVKRLRDPQAGENEVGPHNQKPPHY